MAAEAQVKALQQQLAQLQRRCADQEALRQELDQMAERQKSKEEELRSLSKGVTVVMSRDRNLTKYEGSDGEDFETWEADALAAISDPVMGDKEKCEFLYNKLEGVCAGRFSAREGLNSFRYRHYWGHWVRFLWRGEWRPGFWPSFGQGISDLGSHWWPTVIPWWSCLSSWNVQTPAR